MFPEDLAILEPYDEPLQIHHVDGNVWHNCFSNLVRIRGRLHAKLEALKRREIAIGGSSTAHGSSQDAPAVTLFSRQVAPLLGTPFSLDRTAVSVNKVMDLVHEHGTTRAALEAMIPPDLRDQVLDSGLCPDPYRSMLVALREVF